MAKAHPGYESKSTQFWFWLPGEAADTIITVGVGLLVGSLGLKSKN